jgi:hypothetical protein
MDWSSPLEDSRGGFNQVQLQVRENKIDFFGTPLYSPRNDDLNMVNSTMFFSKYGEFMSNFPPIFFPTCHHVNEVN